MRNNFKPLSWTKQKVDRIISNEIVSKSRDSIETQVYPTARIIKDVSTSDTEIYVDNAQFFNYEENESAIVITSFDALIVDSVDPVSAAVTAVVSAAGTVQSLNIVTAGAGYTGSSVEVKIGAPKQIGVGIGNHCYSNNICSKWIIKWNCQHNKSRSWIYITSNSTYGSCTNC